MKYLISFIVLLSVVFVQVLGHGYMTKPINRSSRWRLDPQNFSIPHEYDDAQFFCGGYSVLFDINGGKCGPCGNDWRDPVPRSNENTGTYGNGVVVATYSPGSLIDTNVFYVANHAGLNSYQLCKLTDPNAPETEECFQKLPLGDGSYFQNVDMDRLELAATVQLPAGFTCDRCVLRWHYTAGNRWGDCGNGTSAIGCGPQETFRSCADISIL